MTPGIRSYRERVAKWMMARLDAGGTLPECVESSHVEAVDRIWSRLSEEEQEAIEAERLCKQRVWRDGKMGSCGNVDHSSAMTGICHLCAARELPHALDQRQRAATALDEAKARVLYLEIAATPQQHPWREG